MSIWKTLSPVNFKIRPHLIAMAIGLVSLGLGSARLSADTIIYDASGNPQNPDNFIPFSDDGTPSRPEPGDQLGNTITFAGSLRSATTAVATFGLNNNGSVALATQPNTTFTLSFYAANGALDPNGSGLLGPGTLLESASATVPVSNTAGDTQVTFNFGGAVTLPNTVIAVLSSNHALDYFGAQGTMGPDNSGIAPTVGSGQNTVWFDSPSTSTWLANNTWAISDGAVTNFFSLQVQAVPEPSAMVLLGLGGLGLLLAGKARRRPIA